ncbi:MAG: ornithine aminomutase subunit alpha [Eubacteriales bacterium]|nr:ornithine aminomutase subunit alpha [Eubacteriales bacterium]
MARPDDFATRRQHLANLSDEELYERFWELADKIVEPMLDAGKVYTTPAIERSVLLRMGFSSVEAKPIVDGLLERELLGHGAGNCVYLLARKLDLPIREAGLSLIQGKNWDLVPGLFA